MKNKEFPSLRTVSSALNMEAPTISRWLSELGGEPERSGLSFQMDQNLCVTLAVCGRLSAVRALDFQDTAIRELLTRLRDGKIERKAIIVIAVTGSQRRVYLSGEEDLVLAHVGNGSGPGGTGLSWIGQSHVVGLIGRSAVSQIGMNGIHEAVDALFAEKEEPVEVK